jgi:hypothetical protein
MAFSAKPDTIVTKCTNGTMTMRDSVQANRRLLSSTRYSICTIVSRPDEYAEMIQSFKKGGFDGEDCEFLCLDNSSQNIFDAFKGNNLFLTTARGEFVILCHQDVLLLNDGRVQLEAALRKLTEHDPRWAACGNAGGDQNGRLAIRISDPHGSNQSFGTFPAKVQSLDENFIVVRRSANLALSNDLTGFHLYGTDLCIIADILGYSCYVIDFHLRHKSPGKTDEQFFLARAGMIQKYRRALRSRSISTTCTSMFLSGVPLLGNILSNHLVNGVAGRFRRTVARFRSNNRDGT